jgi:alkanesulfonate monooxygenase SsuD/methylene tetrahydromethanopterin reductase-like flavin-dependent oxidoreductase (luciferase family)
MRVGVFYFPTDYGIDIRELARAAEERGFGSLLLPEHTHIPKSRRTPYPGGGELPKASRPVPLRRWQLDSRKT